MQRYGASIQIHFSRLQLYHLFFDHSPVKTDKLQQQLVPGTPGSPRISGRPHPEAPELKQLRSQRFRFSVLFPLSPKTQINKQTKEQINKIVNNTDFPGNNSTY